jgi:hypothetical protein
MLTAAAIFGALATLGAAARRKRATQPVLVPVKADRRRNSR